MFSSFPRGCGKGDELAVLWSRLGEVEFWFYFALWYLDFFLYLISLFSSLWGLLLSVFLSVLASYLWTGMRAI